MKIKCNHCKGDLSIRNPKGFCDHLHYPECCEVCENEKPTTSRWHEEIIKIVYRIGFSARFDEEKPDLEPEVEKLKTLLSKVEKESYERGRREVVND